MEEYLVSKLQNNKVSRFMQIKEQNAFQALQKIQSLTKDQIMNQQLDEIDLFQKTVKS